MTSKTKQFPSLFFFACLTMKAREALYNFLAYNSLYFLSVEVCKSNKEDSCLSGFRGFKQRLVLSEVSPPRNTTLTACGLSVYVCACACTRLPHKTHMLFEINFHLAFFWIPPTGGTCLAWQLHWVSGESYHLHVHVLVSLAWLISNWRSI